MVEEAVVAYLVFFAVVLGINLLPAFGPPTWTIIVFCRLHWHLSPVALVIIGALAAATGRLLLALAARHFNDRLPKRLRNNLAAARTLLDGRRGGALAIGGLFVFSPLPSAQLFVAAGLLELNLAPLIAAFFVGRLLSYSLYASAATLADSHLHGGVAQLIGSPWAIALQVALLALVCAFPFINWAGMLDRQQERHVHRGGTPTT